MYTLIQLRMLFLSGRDPARSLPLRRGFLLIPLILVCFAFAPQMHAQLNPPPDGCYPNLTTAEGCFALFNLTSGVGNTGLGQDALFSDTTGNWNTGVGAVALGYNNGDLNTALGVAGLLLNDNGTRNTAVGGGAMAFNIGGNAGDGSFNDALGAYALFYNTTGSCNVALGDSALLNSMSGDNNVAIGCDAGSSITTGSNNIYISNLGVDNESNTIRIGDPAIHQNAYIAGIPAGGLAAILFDYNTGAVTIGVGGAVPFSQAPLIVGTAISKTNDTTFTVNKNGVYRVTYTLRTALLSLLANVQVHVNGVGVGPTAALVVAGTSVSDQVTFQANANDPVQLVVGGVALTLGAGDNATINIDKVQ